jgi:very-short-patch-repair endonuclease
VNDDVVADRPWSTFERDPLTELLDRQDGVIARWQAQRFLTEQAIRHRIESGRWRRLHRGVLHTYGGSLTEPQRWWVAVLALVPHSRSTVDGWPIYLGGITALKALGLRNVRADRIHVIVPDARRVTAPAGVVVHRVSDLPDEDPHLFVRPPTTMPGRAVVDAAAWARSGDEARLIIAASFQQRLVSGPEVAAVLDRMPTVRRRFLTTTTARDCAAGSHSIGELDLVTLCRRSRLPLPTRQLRRRDSTGRLRYLDACFDDWKLVVEVDGAHHAEVGQMWDDSARQNDLALAGYVVLRFPVVVVRTQPRRVAAEIRAALQAAGWRP